MNFWVISNLLGMIGYLWIASAEWLPVGADRVVAGTPSFGDALVALPSIAILFVFFIANMTVLGMRILGKSNIKFYVWFIIAGLWFCTLGYDADHSPLFVEPEFINEAGVLIVE